MEWIHIPEKNLPSTYQQVIRNMLYIQEEVLPVVDSVHEYLEPEVERHAQYISDVVEPLVDSVNEVITPAVNKLNSTIFNPDAAGNSDVVMGDDGIMKVIGMRTDRIAPDNAMSSSIDAYGRNVTSRVTEAASVGLAGRYCVNSEYVTLVTVIPSDNAPSWQIALGDDIVSGTYVRTSDGNGGWGEWMRTPYKQLLYSINPPSDEKRDIGEYWMQEVYPPSKYHLSDVTDPLNLDYIDINDESWERISAVDLSTGEIVSPSMEDLELFDLVGSLSFIDITSFHEYDFTVDTTDEFSLIRIGGDADGEIIPFKPEDVSFINVPTYSFSSVGGARESDAGINSQDAEFVLQPVSEEMSSHSGFIALDLENPESCVFEAAPLAAQ